MEQPPFISFRKIARLARDAQVRVLEDGTVLAGSRNRYLTPEDDQFGFAAWVRDHETELRELGFGLHFGEWWGQKIQRAYGLTERRFSLFNLKRWGETRPACCHVVPVLYEGTFLQAAFEIALDRLKLHGSFAAPGFMRPEGIIIWHAASGTLFKRTIEKDEEPKSRGERP
jgi:hypothetical protein